MAAVVTDAAGTIIPSPNATDMTDTGTTGGTTNPTVQPTPKPAFETFRDMLTSLVGFDPVKDAALLQELYSASDRYIADGIDFTMVPSLLAGSADLEKIAPTYKNYLGSYNTIRGLNVDVTSVADFVQARNAYKSLFTQYGMSDLATDANADKFLMNQVSAAEAATRLNTAYNAVLNADAALKEQLKTYYPSLQTKDIVATMLGVGKTVDQLQKEINIAGIKAESTLAGVTPTLAAEELVAQGVSRAEARAGYQQTAQEIAPYTAAAERAGVSTADLQKELESENLLGLASQRRKRIQSAEQNLFTGSSGTGGMSLSRQNSAGNF